MDRVFNGDAALTEIKDDEDFLGVKAFAGRIAQSILAQRKKSGLVYGLEGSWGSGKSTLANEILKQVNLQFDALNNKAPIIVRFDPWILRGVQPLVGALLEEVKAAIIEAALQSDSIIEKSSGSLQWIKDKGAAYRAAIIEVSELAASLAEAAMPAETGGASAAGKFVGKTIISTAKSLPKRADDPSLSVQSVKHQKSRVNKAIEKLKRQLIIFIDDIDRLDPSEIMEVLRLVRSVADFSNTTYLLNYDPRIVAHAAEKIHGVSDARTYLEKIVNVPIRVPVPEPFDLKNWFEQEVKCIVRKWRTANGFAAPDSELGLINHAVGHAGSLFLRTPRDVNRSLDAVRLGLDSTKVAIAPAELVWLSIIKIGNSELYSWIERFLTERALTCQGGAEVAHFVVRRFEVELANIASDIGLMPKQLISYLCYYITSVYQMNIGDIFKQGNEKEDINLTNSFKAEDSHSLRRSGEARSLNSPRWYKYYFSYQSPRHEISPAEEERLFERLNQQPESIGEYIFELDANRQTGVPSKAERLFYLLKQSGLTELADQQRFHFLLALATIMDNFPRPDAQMHDRRRRGWEEAADLLRIALINSQSAESEKWVQELFSTGASVNWLKYCLDTWRESRWSEDESFKSFFESAERELETHETKQNQSVKPINNTPAEDIL
jgi:hypothetical protein